MHAHVLQHVSFESLGSIGSWLSQRGAPWPARDSLSQIRC